MSEAHPAGRGPTTPDETAEEDTTDGHHRPAADKPHEPPVHPDAPDQETASAHRRGTRTVRGRWDILLVISVGGALGSLARWAVTAAIPHAAEGVPWGTWLENVTGGFLLGLLMVLILDVWPPSRYVRPFLGVGILGGYTTFSTYMLDTRTLLAQGQVPIAFGYLFGTLLTGLVAVWAGVLVARTVAAAIERRHRHRNRHPQRSRDPGAAPAPERHPAQRSGEDSRQDPDDVDLRSRP